MNKITYYRFPNAKALDCQEISKADIDKGNFGYEENELIVAVERNGEKVTTYEVRELEDIAYFFKEIVITFEDYDSIAAAIAFAAAVQAIEIALQETA